VQIRFGCGLDLRIYGKCFWTHVDMDIFSCFGMWNYGPQFVCIFNYPMITEMGKKRNRHSEKSNMTQCLAAINSAQ
jgi:hypothetical protein